MIRTRITGMREKMFCEIETLQECCKCEQHHCKCLSIELSLLQARDQEPTVGCMNIAGVTELQIPLLKLRLPLLTFPYSCQL